MHISEGVLNPEILIGGAVISTAFVAYALKTLKNEEIPLVAVFSALFFIGSFIHVPIGPASIHLVLNGIIGAILGIRAFLAIGVALLLQGVLFGFGGITTLGVNTLNIALPGVIVYYLLKVKFDNILLNNIKYFFVGFGSVALSALMLSLTLALNGEAFYDVARLAFVSNVPIMAIEGIITMFAINFLQKVYPKVFRGSLA